MTQTFASPASSAERAQIIDPPKALIFLFALALVISADWLFWNQSVGISLAIFGTLLASAFAFASPAHLRERRFTVAIGVLVFALLPVIEHLQLLSVAFLIVGLIVFTLIATGRVMPGTLRNAWSLIAFPFVGLGWFFHDFELTAARLIPMLRTRPGALLAWGMPIMLGLVFLMLFAAANPVIEGWTDALLDIDLAIDEPERIVFWIAIALGAWPFLRIASRIWPIRRLPNTTQAARPPRSYSLISQASVANALVLFNVMFAVQTILDGLYLWGGAELPDGMTYASYAHRGAYPLVATAIMAGAFVIITTTLLRPTPFMLRLIYLWIGQNILLLISSVLRLDLYVEVYALTYLRVAAFIWMGLVTFGFATIIARLIYGKSNQWLMTCNTAAATVVLYLCCFANFADLIARYNINHSQPIFAGGVPIDRRYICSLGPHALPAIDEFEARTNSELCEVTIDSAYAARPVYYAPDSWRGRGLRDWRLERYLAKQSAGQ